MSVHLLTVYISRDHVHLIAPSSLYMIRVPGPSGLGTSICPSSIWIIIITGDVGTTIGNAVVNDRFPAFATNPIDKPLSTVLLIQNNPIIPPIVGYHCCITPQKLTAPHKFLHPLLRFYLNPQSTAGYFVPLNFFMRVNISIFRQKYYIIIVIIIIYNLLGDFFPE